MKKTLLLIYTVFFVQSLVAQQFHNNAPCLSGNANGPNYMNWTASNFTLYTNSLGTTTIASPFHLNSLNNPNVNEFSLYTAKDYNSAEGWELWQYDFGTPTAKTDVPYFILYNRYTGLLRVFVAFANLYGQNNGVTISLTYKGSALRSAILENYNTDGSRKATENFSNDVIPITHDNYYLNQVLTWYHSDYYLHYDPCICNYENSLKLEVKLTNAGALNFNLNGTAIGNFPTGQSTDGNGRIGQKGIFNTLIGLNNQDYKSFPFFRDFYAGLNFGNNLANNIWQSKPSTIKTAFNTIFTGFSSGLPVVGSVAKFLTSIFDKSNPSAQSLKPIVFDINLRGSGNLTYTYNYGYLEMVTPGSYQTLISVNVRPYYNKPVGIFTLLKEPIIEFSRYWAYNDEYGSNERHETTIDETYQLNSSDISYVVNPHAGFDLSQSTIKAQLIYTSVQFGQYESNIFDLGCIKSVRKSFQSYESYSPDFSEWNYRTGFVPDYVDLKIIATFKIANSGLEVPYIATYRTKRISNENLAWTGDSEPSLSCSIPVSPASNTDINSVCWSEAYKTKSSAYLKKSNSASTTTQFIINSENRVLNHIFPNPVKDIVNIVVADNLKNKSLLVVVSDAAGRILIKETFRNSLQTLQLNTRGRLTSGIYFIKIIDGTKVISESKFLKQ